MTSIIQFADIHFGVEDKEAVAAIAATVETLKPDVTVICGDITQNGTARDWIRSLPGPKVITPGNHDTPMFGLFQRFFDPFGRYNRIIAPLSEPHYTDKNVSIMPLNTSRGWQAKTDWSLGVVDMDELDMVINNLKATLPSTFDMFTRLLCWSANRMKQKLCLLVQVRCLCGDEINQRVSIICL